jgi:hypothetical protein
MTLNIWVSPFGRLFCYIPEEGIEYQVVSWAEFMAATGTRYLDEFTVHISN